MPVPAFTLGGPAASANNIAPSLPAHVAGDILFCVLQGDNLNNIAIPAGWEHVDGSPRTVTDNAHSDIAWLIWKRAASSAEASPAIATTGDHNVARTFKITPAPGAPAMPWDYVTNGQTTVNATSVSITGGTTLGADRRIMFVVIRPDDNSSTTNFGVPVNASLTTLAEHSESGVITGDGGGFVISSGVKTTAGAVGTTTISSAASTTFCWWSLAMRDVAPAGGTPTAHTSIADPGTFTATGVVGRDDLSSKASLSSYEITGIEAFANVSGAVSNPKTATFVDTFNLALDTVNKWSVSGDPNFSAYTSGGELLTTLDPSGVGAVSNDGRTFLDLSASAMYVRMTPPTGPTAEGVQTAFVLFAANGDFLRFIWNSDGNSLTADSILNGVYTFHGRVLNIGANERWMQFREASGTIYFETAPDNGTSPCAWAVLGTLSASAFVAGLGSLKPRFFTQRWKIAAGNETTGPARYDGLNTVAGSGVAAVTSIADPGSFFTSTANAFANRAVVSQGLAGAYAINGVNAFAVRNVVTNGAPTTYAISGVAAFANRAMPSNGQPGSFAVVGVAATAVRAVATAAMPTAYALMGVAAISLTSKNSIGDPGVFGIVGVNSFGASARAANTQPMTFAISGYASDTDVALIGNGDAPGVFVTSGAPASGGIGRNSHAVPGALAIAGASAVSGVAYTRVANPAAYVTTGAPATGVIGRVYVSDAQPGLFAIAGQDATTRRAIASVAAPAEFGISGSAARDLQDTIADAGSFAYIGHDGFANRMLLTFAEDAEYFIDGFDAFGMREIPASVAEPGSYSIAGYDAFARVGADITSIAESAIYVIAGYEARAPQALSSVAESGLYFIKGFAATSFEGEIPTGGGLITRTIIKRVAVPGQAKPSRETILSAQRSGVDTTALGYPPAPPAPATIVIAPAPVTVEMFRPSPVQVSAAPLLDAVLSDAGATINPEDMKAAQKHLARLTREASELAGIITERESQIEDLEGLVGAAFAAGIAMGDDA